MVLPGGISGAWRLERIIWVAAPPFSWAGPLFSTDLFRANLAGESARALDQPVAVLRLGRPAPCSGHTRWAQRCHQLSQGPGTSTLATH